MSQCRFRENLRANGELLDLYPFGFLRFYTRSATRASSRKKRNAMSFDDSPMLNARIVENFRRCSWPKERDARWLDARDILKKSHGRNLPGWKTVRFEQGIFIRGDWFPRVPRLRPSTGFSLVTGVLPLPLVPRPTFLSVISLSFISCFHSPPISDDTRRRYAYPCILRPRTFSSNRGKRRVTCWPVSNFPLARAIVSFSARWINAFVAVRKSSSSHFSDSSISETKG